MAFPPEDAAEQRICMAAGIFMYSEVLFTSNASGLMPFLQTPRSVASICAQCGWADRPARLFLDTLAAMDLVVSDGESYCNTETASACLVPGGDQDLTAFVRHMARCRDAWRQLDTALTEGKGLFTGRHRPDTAAFDDYVTGMDQLARINAPRVVKCLDLHGCRHLLDAGSGAGAWAAAFLSANPDLRVTLMDAPEILEVARRKLKEKGFSDRCAFLPGNLEKDMPPVTYDAVFISNVLHGLESAACQRVIHGAYAALKPGGRLIARDFFTGENDTPLFNVLFGLHMFLHSNGGQTWPRSRMAQWSREAGFEEGRWLECGAKSRIWLASRKKN